MIKTFVQKIQKNFIDFSLFIDTFRKLSKDPNKKLMDNIDAYDKKNKNN